MKVLRVEEAKITPNPHGVDGRKIYDGEYAQVIHITLKPGEGLKKHTTPVDVLFYVLNGKGIIEIGEEKMEVEKDCIIESPAKIPHRWYNNGDDILRVLVIKISH